MRGKTKTADQAAKATVGGMRLDKYLKVSRIIKRRSVANDVCDMGRVTVNGREAKPSAQITAGDMLEIRFGAHLMRAKVLKVAEHIAKQDAQGMYEILEET